MSYEGKSSLAWIAQDKNQKDTAWLKDRRKMSALVQSVCVVFLYIGFTENV